MRRVAWIVLLIFFSAHLLFRIGGYWDRYTEKISGEQWREQYLQSQWVVPNSIKGIGDDGLYAYHGWELVRGGDPTIINPEVPPVGKYFIGLLVLGFKNSNIFGLITGLFFLGAFYLLNRELFRDRLLAFIPIFLVSFDSLFYTQLQASFLDALHAGLLFLTFTFFLKQRFIVSMLFLGLFASVKFSSLAVFALGAVLIYLLLQKNWSELKRFIPTIIIVPIIILISYIRFFIMGHTLLDFFRVQKYIFEFYQNGVKPPIFGMVFPMIFLNQWYTWWNGVQQVLEWTVFWPISFILGLSSVRFLAVKSPFSLIAVWCGLYLIFLLLTPVWPRYLLLLLPFLYNLSIWGLSKSIKLRS